jgi:hypothetical protein
LCLYLPIGRSVSGFPVTVLYEFRMWYISLRSHSLDHSANRFNLWSLLWIFVHLSVCEAQVCFSALCLKTSYRNHPLPLCALIVLCLRKKTRDLACAEVENTLCSCVRRCGCVRKAEGQTYSSWPLHLCLHCVCSLDRACMQCVLVFMLLQTVLRALQYVQRSVQTTCFALPHVF